MKLTIHRGTREIGGTCIELVEPAGGRVVLDLGLPLQGEAPGRARDLAGDTGRARAEGLLPAVPGLYRDEPGPRPLALLLSHDHPDHTGLLGHVHPEVPVGLGAKVLEVWRRVGPLLGYPDLGGRPVLAYGGGPLDLGGFRVTPHLMDHSAFDAHALEIAAGGRRLFYSGDFRAHGRKGGAFAAFCRTPPPPVEVLLLEGTTLSRPDLPAVPEAALEQRVRGLLAGAAGPAFAVFSPMNLDRLVTFIRAARGAGRKLYLDGYGACCLEAYRAAGVRLPGLGRGARDIGVLLAPHRVLDGPDFADFKARLVAAVADPYDRALDRPSLVLLRRGMERHLLRRSARLAGGLLLHSVWPGYLERDPWPRTFADRTGLDFHAVHTSGHADATALKRLAAALAPARIVPVHTQAPERYAALFPGTPVACLRDGEQVEVGDLLAGPPPAAQTGNWFES